MKKRLPLIISFLLFLALCASGAYWGMLLFKRPERPVIPPPPAAQTEIPVENAATLFGGKLATAAISNYQLKGVISARNPKGGIAILSADGKPSQSVAVGKEVAPGVQVTEVHKQYVMLEEGGVAKRLELPDARGNLGSNNGNSAPVPPIQPPPQPVNNGVPPPPPSMNNPTGMNLSNIRPPEPNVPPLMGTNPNAPNAPPSAPPATPQPAMLSAEPGSTEGRVSK